MSSTIASIACIGTGRLAHARVMPLNSFWRSNASRRPSCLMTISDVCATRSYVVKRCPHLRHSRRRRIASSDSRVSMTLLSSLEQYGQRMTNSTSTSPSPYKGAGTDLTLTLSFVRRRHCLALTECGEQAAKHERTGEKGSPDDDD